jgi:hypothetical protein
MGEYCAATAAAEGEPAVAFPAAAATAKRPYGEYDRCSTKQVFDNLHGNISLDPVSGCVPPAPCSFPLSSPPPPLASLPLRLFLLLFCCGGWWD